MSSWRSRFPTAFVWLTRVCIVFAAFVVTVEWVNTRAAMLRQNQFSGTPVVLNTYSVFHAMATGMREGRIGQVDMPALRRHLNERSNDPWAPFERLPPEAAHQWVNYYTLDVGYSFIVEAARLLFPALPDNHLRPLALQLVADAAMVIFVYFLFSQWHMVLGLVAAYLYVVNGVFYNLVSFAFYYYWDIPLTFVVLGALLLGYQRPHQAGAWLTLGGAVLGFGVWLRGSWWPLALYLLVVALWTHRLRRRLLPAVVAFAILAAPAVIRASYARGTLTFTTRAVWHVALVGLGYYPNPYGLEANDGAIFELTRRKYGVEFRQEDYWVHDQAAKKEFLDIWHRDRGFVIRSFFGRLTESTLGTTSTSVLSFLFLSNVTYRILCLLGLVAMVVRGGERRLLGVAAAGMYIIYVSLTSAFYFVGLAYANVSEATLFVLFIGLIDTVMLWIRRLAAHIPHRRTIAASEPGPLVSGL
jgi:hypothetical protein